MEISLLHPRRSNPVELTGTRARDTLVRDEALAENREHWWLHEVVWTSASPLRNVAAGVDPDGNDLGWIGWGEPSVVGTIRRLETFLLSGSADYLPPFFAFGDEVESFDSVGALLRYVEPWDVTADLAVFDSTGRRMKVRAEGVVRTRRTVGGGWNLIDRQAPTAPDGAALTARLQDYVDRLAPTAATAHGVGSMVLPGLVAFVHRRTRCG